MRLTWAQDQDLRWEHRAPLFVREYLQMEPYSWQDEVLDYPGNRLLALAPRGSGKSRLAQMLALHESFCNRTRQTGATVLTANSHIARHTVEQLQLTAPNALLRSVIPYQVSTVWNTEIMVTSDWRQMIGQERTTLIVDEAAYVQGETLREAVQLMRTIPNSRILMFSTEWWQPASSSFFEQLVDGAPENGWDQVDVRYA